MEPRTILIIGDLIGVFAFAVSGALLAARLKYDIVGSLLLGGLTGLGGGVMRDVILGQPPLAFTEFWYIIVPVVATVLVYFARSRVERQTWVLQYADACGLGLFAVVGTIKGLNYGMAPWASVFMGLMTAIGGGVLRDVVANVPPMVMQREHLYAVPAFLGAALTALVSALEVRSVFSLLACAAVVIGLRIASIHLGWGVPPAARDKAARERQEP